MTTSEVARTLNVSNASVRNWIKTGYLEYSRDTGITRSSFEDFRSSVAGKEKLTKRANKSQIDSHNHSELASTILSDLKQNANPTELARRYENELSNAHQNKEGIYYTPENVCNVMFSDIAIPSKNHKFCDPCCGSGNFIMAAIHNGFLPENVYGYDTDPVAVELTKRRIYQETGYLSDNIIYADFLDIASDSSSGVFGFDAILTNPPWGKKLPKSEKERLGNLLGAGRSLDTSSLFLFASMKVLKSEGILALLLPESFFKITTFQDARKYLLKFSLVSVRDFEKPFKGLITKAQSFCVKKLKQGEVETTCYNTSSVFNRRQATFVQNPASIINFECDRGEASVLAKLFSKPHITLKDRARWGLGIVTGNNKKFCKDTLADDLMPVYKGIDIHKGRLSDPTSFIPRNLSLYQQVAPVELFEADEKILYRFISSGLVMFHDTQKSYFLNSVNMLIPFFDFPISNENIVRLFNTDLFNWAYKKIFSTHKILRSDLERLPLPIEFLEGNKKFTEEGLLEYYGIARRKNGAFRT